MKNGEKYGINPTTLRQRPWPFLCFRAFVLLPFDSSPNEHVHVSYAGNEMLVNWASSQTSP